MASVQPKFGEGIFLTTDVAEILHLPYHKVKNLMKGFWQTQTFGRTRNKAVNFLALIEFYIYYYLREKKMTAQSIKKIHKQLSRGFNTPYPFAASKLLIDDKNVWIDFNSFLIKADGKLQPSFRSFLENTIRQIEYGDDLLAKRFYPLKDSKNVVVDPERQFGKPIIKGKGVRTDVIYKFYLGGEPPKNICILYDLTENEVNDAIRYHAPKVA